MSNPAHEGIYAIEDPLKDGNDLRCFSSGLGLQVARIEAPEGQLVGYGEASTIEVALMDAAENYRTGEGYERQYRGPNARYPHQIYGSEESVSPLDEHLKRGGKLLARWACSAVVAGLYTLEQLPTDDIINPLWELDNTEFPVVISQFGRAFMFYPVERGLGIVALPRSDGSKDSCFACVVQEGTGDTLRGAIDAAIIAEPVESERDVFSYNYLL